MEEVNYSLITEAKMPTVIVNKDALTIKTNASFLRRLTNLLINPFRYLLTGKVIY